MTVPGVDVDIDFLADMGIEENAKTLADFERLMDLIAIVEHNKSTTTGAEDDEQ